MSRSLGRPSALALAAVLAVTLTGCPNQDLDGADAANVLTDAGASEEVANCLGDRFQDDLSQDEINEVGGADDLADLDTDLEDKVQTILDECTSTTPAVDDEDQGSGEPSESDGADTTEADAGDETTTTAGE